MSAARDAHEHGGLCPHCSGTGRVWSRRKAIAGIGTGLLGVGLGIVCIAGAVWLWGSGGKGGVLSVLLAIGGVLLTVGSALHMPQAWADGWVRCACSPEAGERIAGLVDRAWNEVVRRWRS